jgi:hypothetical protein
MKTTNEIVSGIRSIFDGVTHVSVAERNIDLDRRIVRIELYGKIRFTFASMALLAEVIGTENLNFCAHPGDPGQMGSSWTGRYGEEDGYFAIEAWG